MSQNVDWAYWAKLPEVKAFEAIALLFDTEPGIEPPEIGDALPEYPKALRLLLACLSDRSTFTPGTLNMGDPSLNGVLLREVGTWALANGYKLPIMFPRPMAVSKAPEPIRPLNPSSSGRAQSGPIARSRAIDWPFWKAMRTVKLWQACALVVNIDPDTLKQHRQAWMAGPGAGPVFDSKCFSSPASHERFDKALRLAENAVSYMDGPIVPRGQPYPGSNKGKDVLLSEVVAFFQSCEWPDIPEPMQSLPAPAAPLTTPEPETYPAIKKAGYVLKKAALIKKYSNGWASIEADFNHASENGLTAAAKATGHGDWYESAVLAWADQRGKRTTTETKTAPNSVFNLPGTRHTL